MDVCAGLPAAAPRAGEACRDERQQWETHQEAFSLREALEVQGAELEALRRENRRLQAEGQELGRLRETLDALREESRRLELHERQVAELHEDLHALRQENHRLQSLAGSPEVQEQSKTLLQAAEEEISTLRRALQQQAAELDRLQRESQRAQIQGKELTELREELKLERISSSAQQYELMTLHAFLKERGIDVDTLEGEDEGLAAQLFPPADLSADFRVAATPPHGTAPLPADAAAGSPGSCNPAGRGPPRRSGASLQHSVAFSGNAQADAAAAALQRQGQVGPRDRRIVLDLCAHEQELSGVSDIQDETVSLDSVLAGQQQQQQQQQRRPREAEPLEACGTSPEVPSSLSGTLRQDGGRFGAQEEEIARLRQALELQTANVDTLLREGRRLQALEGQLADLRGAAPGGGQAGPGAGSGGDASQRSSMATEEAWSLTSTSETSPPAGQGFESVSMSSPSQRFASCERGALCAAAPPGTVAPPGGGSCRRWSGHHGQAWADAEEPWRLVRTILGMLDGLQQKLAAGGAERGGLGEGWSSVASVDIRILVGVGAGALGPADEEAGRSFMYVLL